MVKKLTVSGIIGNTQGVSKARKPPNIPAKNIPRKDLSAVVLASLPQPASRSARICATDFGELEELFSVLADAVSG